MYRWYLDRTHMQEGDAHMPNHSPGSFSENAPENYERYFVPAIGGPLAADLLESAALRSGERVLDVACGTGIVARLAAGKVGPDGAVTGLDVNPGMLAVARSVTPSGTSIAWHEGNAESLPLPDGSFDVALCQMGLQFMPDPRSALAEMHRVLSSNGRVVLNLPGPASPLFEALAEGLRRHVSPQAAGFVQQVFSLHDTEEIGALLLGAGFRDLDVQAHTKRLSLPPLDEFLWQYVYSTPLAAAVQEADEGTRVALEEDVLGSWRDLAGEGSGVETQRIVLASALK